MAINFKQDREAGWDRVDQMGSGYYPPQPQRQGRGTMSYYQTPTYQGTGLMGNPYNFGMQNMMLGSMNNGQNFANSFNQGQTNYQAARLAAMPYNNQAQGIANQRLNFQDLMSILPQLFGSFGGHILGPQAGGFNTDYGASASMGGGQQNQPSALPGMLKQYH